MAAAPRAVPRPALPDPSHPQDPRAWATAWPPWVISGLAVTLALAPLLQAASLAGLRVGNFAPGRPWNFLAYGVAAPYVAVLLWRCHPRARFAAYVFLSHETVRGLHFHRWDAVLVAVAWITLLQLPSARAWAPSLQPAEVRARLARRLGRS